MKKIITILGCLLLYHISIAQDDVKKQVTAALKKLAERYRQPKSIGYDISYKYTWENKPEEILDSMAGSFKMNDTKYWYNIAGTEAAGDSTVMMMLFKEDGVMYLSKPSKMLQHFNPAIMMDSFVMDKKITGAAISNRNGMVIIELTCMPGLAYKKIEYHIDQKTGWLRKMISTVEAKQFYDPSVREKVAGNVYAVMEADFSNYQEADVPKDLFDLSKYFKKTGGTYVTVPPYDSYKIFLGSPNL